MDHGCRFDRSDSVDVLIIAVFCKWSRKFLGENDLRTQIGRLQDNHVKINERATKTASYSLLFDRISDLLRKG